MEKNSKSKLEVVEYRAGDNMIRLFLLRPRDPGPTVSLDVENLRCFRRDPGPVYQIIFLLGGREHCHEYPIREVARTEEEWLPKE